MRSVLFLVTGRPIVRDRRSVPSLSSFSTWGTLVLFAVAVALLATGPAQAQSPRTTDLFYLRLGQGLSNFTRTGASHAGSYDTGLFTGARYAPSAELGYRFSPALTLGLGYQLGTNVRDAGSETVQAMQLLTRYKAGAESWAVAPFVDLGINASTGRDRFRYGPSIGAGLDIAVDNRLSFFVESQFNLTVPAAVPFFPGETADAYDSTAGVTLDVLSVTSIGAEFVLHSTPNGPTIRRLTGPMEVQVGEPATFSARLNAENVTKPVERAWTFGNGESGTGSTATHTFRRPGRHVVIFEAENQAGRDRTSLTVTVEDTLAPPRIALAQIAPSSALVGQELSFQGEADGGRPLSYEWRFGDGTTAKGTSASHTYDEPGTYTVQLTVSNAAGSASQTGSLQVNNRPTYSEPGRYVVQIGAFGERRNAERKALRALFDGHAARIRPAAQQGETLYRVWVGHFWAEDAARRSLSQLQDDASDAFVRKAQTRKAEWEASNQP